MFIFIVALINCGLFIFIRISILNFLTVTHRLAKYVCDNFRKSSMPTLFCLVSIRLFIVIPLQVFSKILFISWTMYIYVPLATCISYNIFNGNKNTGKTFNTYVSYYYNYIYTFFFTGGVLVLIHYLILYIYIDAWKNPYF